MNQKGTFKLVGKKPMHCLRLRGDGKKTKKVGEKFLGTHANETANYDGVVPNGVNDMLPILVEYEVQSLIASGETLTLTLPDHLDNSLAASFLNYVPVGFACWSNADPQIPQHQPHKATGLVMTSHDRDTGTTIFTAGVGTVVDDSVLTVLYAPQTLGTT